MLFMGYAHKFSIRSPAHANKLAFAVKRIANSLWLKQHQGENTSLFQT